MLLNCLDKTEILTRVELNVGDGGKKTKADFCRLK